MIHSPGRVIWISGAILNILKSGITVVFSSLFFLGERVRVNVVEIRLTNWMIANLLFIIIEGQVEG